MWYAPSLASMASRGVAITPTFADVSTTCPTSKFTLAPRGTSLPPRYVPVRESRDNGISLLL